MALDGDKKRNLIIQHIFKVFIKKNIFKDTLISFLD